MEDRAVSIAIFFIIFAIISIVVFTAGSVFLSPSPDSSIEDGSVQNADANSDNEVGSKAEKLSDYPEATENTSDTNATNNTNISEIPEDFAEKD